MNLLKKIGAVVATVAVCSAMVVPTIANAQATGCPPHHYIKTNEINTIDTYQHGYFVDLTEDGNEIWENCSITIRVHQYDYECKNCGYTLKDAGPGRTEEHSDCGL